MLNKAVCLAILVLFLYGCSLLPTAKPNLKDKIAELINDCTCDDTKCLCEQKYGDGQIWVDCKDSYLVELRDVLMKCNYGYSLSGENINVTRQ